METLCDYTAEIKQEIYSILLGNQEPFPFVFCVVTVCFEMSLFCLDVPVFSTLLVLLTDERKIKRKIKNFQFN